MLAPSKHMDSGELKTPVPPNVPMTAPVLAFNFDKVLSLAFDTQMLVPSKAMAAGPEPTGYVPMVAPVLALSLVTLAPDEFAAQRLAPSKQTAVGLEPAG